MHDMVNKVFDIKKYIIFEDEDIIGINKPSGVLTIPDGYQPNLPNLRDELLSEHGSIWVVHRLDKLTSGVVLFAKNKDSHKSLSVQFQNRQIRKKYIALMFGSPFWNKRTIDYPIRINGDHRHRTVTVQANGKRAVTKVENIRKYNSYSYVRVFPKSGYTHQIRCHLASIGHPIIGDNLYSLLRTKDSINEIFAFG
jgi:RluA family pseudouridine synthase